MNLLDAFHNSILGAGHLYLIAVAIAAVGVTCFFLSIGISGTVFRQRERKLWL